jgi:hypothetical protein
MFDTEEDEDLDLMEIRAGDVPVQWMGVSSSGLVYLQGDLHPDGSAIALLKAAKTHVPYVAVSAVRVLFPADWLAGECAHDMDRLRVIQNAVAFARGSR